jgi:hypothetical protein
MKIRTVKVEIEFSLVWAEQNAKLFVDGINDIAKEYSYLEFKHDIDFSREGFVTITCTGRN